ncbi:MAG: hypothetical protein WDN75_03995 [Bacteroidota bacterium]
MIRQATIARILALIFLVSGIADLGHGIIPYSTHKTNRKEYRVSISNNAATPEGRFNRSKSVSEFEEDVQEILSDTVKTPDTQLAVIISISDKKKTFDDQFRHLDIPIFLKHRQILV